MRRARAQRDGPPIRRRHLILAAPLRAAIDADVATWADVLRRAGISLE